MKRLFLLGFFLLLCSCCVAGIPGVCYQETATVATACGGLSSGSYAFNGSFQWPTDWLWDGIYTGFSYSFSKIYPHSYMFVNYSIPQFTVNGTLWVVAYSDIVNVKNASLSVDECIGGDVLELRVGMAGEFNNTVNGSIFECYDGVDWVVVFDNNWLVPNGSKSWVFEESVYWNIGSSNSTVITECPSDLVEFSNFFLILFFGVFLMFAGFVFRFAICGVLGSIVFISSSWGLVRCENSVGWVACILGFVFLLWFSFRFRNS